MDDAGRPSGATSTSAFSVVAEVLAAVSGRNSTDIVGSDRLSSFGLNSLESVKVARMLSDRLGADLPATAVWAHPDVDDLVASMTADARGQSRDSPPSKSVADYEPIAIIGIGCRFPGTRGPAEFFEFLCRGEDPIVTVPPQRWDVEDFYSADPSMPGTAVSRWGGFLDDLDMFDAGFFGMSPREAHQLDPRQRLILECGWEAIENAGIPVDRIRGSRTGVFMASLAANYGSLVFDRHLDIVDAYSGTGNGNSVLANRLSYQLDLCGPSVTVDTACSGSLVAVHLAVASLRTGESSLALAGGVNVILKPDETVFFSKTGALSKQGKCRVFDRDADGIVRSEGCGVVVLKPLSQAVRDGDRIYAQILSTAVNQDGASNGIMAPNGHAQETLLRTAYDSAGIAPTAVQYVEAHGTGTALGDPIEVNALAEVLGRGRATMCALGSVKSNIGHTEAAAGIAGLIKVALSLSRRTIPGNLHFDNPSPLIDFDGLGVRVQTRTGPFPADSQPLICGVSAFGFAGTNAHAVLAEATAAPCPQSPTRGPFVLPISGRTDQALRAQAAAYADVLRGGDGAGAGAYVRAAGNLRTHFPHRAAIWADDPAGLSQRLDEFATAGADAPEGCAVGVCARGGPAPVVWLFSGQGSHWAGMGRGLFAKYAPFRNVIEECEVCFRAWSGRSLIAELAAPPSRSHFDRTEFAQPATVAVQMGLDELFRSFGLAPAVVVGQSLGDIAAARAAGAISISDAMLVACARSSLMARLDGTGRTATVGLDADAAKRFAGGWTTVRVAGRLTDSLTLMSGSAAEMASALLELVAGGVYVRPVRDIGIALHGAGLESVAAEFAGHLAGLEPTTPRITLVTATAGGPVAGRLLDASYWVENLCAPFDLVSALGGVVDRGWTDFLELSPHPMLGLATSDAGERRGVVTRHVGTLERLGDDRLSVSTAVGHLYAGGADLDWGQVCVGGRGPVIDLPTYPWQRERYWYDALTGSPDLQTRLDRNDQHPLLGNRVVLADAAGVQVWQQRLTVARLPWLSDHRADGHPILPGAAYVEMALAAVRALDDNARLRVSAVEFVRPMLVDHAPVVQVVVRQSGGQSTVVISSRRDNGSGEWTVHARAVVGAADTATAAALPADADADADCVGVEELYDRLARIGLTYTGPFRGVSALAAAGPEIVATIEVPFAPGWAIGPIALDACLHAVAAAGRGRDIPRLPSRIDHVEFSGPLPSLVTARIRPRVAEDAGPMVADLTLEDIDGEQIGVICGATFDPVASARGSGGIEDWFYQVDWVAQPQNTTVLPPAPEPFADFATRAGPLAAELGLDEFVPDTVFADLVAAFCRDAVQAVGTPDAITLGQQRFWARVRELAAGSGDQPVDVLAAQIRARHPSRECETLLVERAGRSLPEILCGRTDAAEMLFTGDGHNLLTEFYGQSGWMLYFNRVVAGAVRAAATETQPVRILEIGAGTGATTDHILAALPESACAEYLFTDISPALLARARERFTVPFMRFSTLDIEAAPPPERREQFDVVVAANVLHATADLVTTLRHVSDYLRPGGTLILLEGDGHQSWLDLIVGGTAGWWACADARRKGYPLLAAKDWPHVLSDAGYANAALAPAPDLAPQLVAVARKPNRKPSRDWVIVGEGDPVDGALAELVRKHGDTATLTSVQQLPETLRDASRTVLLVYTGGLALPAWRDLTAADLDFAETGPVWGAVAAVQSAVAAGCDVQIAVVTRGAQPVGPARPLAVAQAALWGVGRVLAGEHPERWGGLIDLDPDSSAIDAAESLYAELDCNRSPEQVALRGGDRFAARLRRMPALGPASPQLRGDGAYLITGGLRGIGLEVAVWMVDHGARHLVLVSRTALPDRRQWRDLAAEHPRAREVAAVRALEERGAGVTVVSVDVTDRVAVNAFLDDYEAAARPTLRGVVHGAGVIDDALLTRVTPRQFADVGRVKGGAAWLLGERLGRQLDFLMMFSSGSSLLGTLGQANYAAGNAVVDALAHSWRAVGVPAISINWGVWGETGIVARRGGVGVLARNGLIEIPTALGLKAFGRVLAHRPVQVAVMPTDWTVWREVYPAALVAPLFSDVLAEDRSDGESTAARVGVLPEGPGQAARAEEIVREVVGRALGTDPAGVDNDVPLSSLGFDSIMAVEVRNALASAGGLVISIVDLLGGLSTREIAHRLTGTHSDDARTGMSPLPTVEMRPGSVVPATPAQVALWRAEQTNVDRLAVYSVPVAAWLRTLLDPVVLSQALERLIRRHDVLHTHFDFDGVLWQTVDEAGPPQLRVNDIGEEPGPACDERVETLLRAFAAEPFDVTTGPLARFLLVQAGGRSVFALSIHHLIFDGWSAGILVGELANTYSALANNTPLPAGERAPSFLDYARWCALPGMQEARRDATSRVVERIEDCWPCEALPLDFPRPFRPSFTGAKIPVDLGAELAASVFDAARSASTTPFTVLVSALGLALAGCEPGGGPPQPVVLGTTPSNRPYPEASGMIGYFVDTTLVAVRPQADPVFGDVVAQVRDDLLDAAAAVAPIDEVLAALRARTGETGVVQVVLTLQNSPTAEADIVESVQTIDNGTAKFDLVLNLIQESTTGGEIGLQGWWEFNTDVLRRASVHAVAERFAAVLAAGCTDPAAPLGALLWAAGHTDSVLAQEVQQ